MKLNDLYANVKALMFEKPSSTIYDAYIAANANRVFREVFEENNMARMFNGREPLDEVPYVTRNSKEDLEDYFEDEYLNGVIPLGIAAYFLIDDDLSKYSIYHTDYMNARMMAQKMVNDDQIREITDASDE